MAGLPPRKGECGQTIALAIVFMTVLLCFAAVVMEGGHAFLIRRDMQGTADAAAMAGVQRVVDSRAEAESTAAEYVDVHNDDSNADVNDITATSAGTADCNGVSVPPYGICVRVERQQSSLFGSLLGQDATFVRAQAVAAASQVRSMRGWLPFGVMEEQFDSGDQIDFRPGSIAEAGSINAPTGDNCRFYGGAGVRDAIKSERFGGEDACPIRVGDSIETQTGVTSGIIRQGFQDRLGGNRDRFEDVFQWDAATSRYIVALPDSPRLGLVPLAGGSGDWPLTAGREITVSGYAFVYIGDRSDGPSYPATSGSGSGLRIHITAVDALLPSDWDTDFMDYDPDSHGIVAYRLVS
ncbi:MAG: hypothetical protein JWO69_1764 [Thermoleophilia bacterium]|nr:hypothetical protein [Thermoleophilia bacterium]